MKIIVWWILIGIFLPFHTAWAQNQAVIDSLQNILDQVKGTDKVMVLNGLAQEYIAFKADKSYALAQEAFELAQQKNDTKGLADSYYFKGYALFQQNDSLIPQALKNFLQALALYENLKDKKGKATALVQIGQVYKARNDYKQALDKFKRAIDIFNEIENTAGKAIGLGQMADVNFRLGRFNEALKLAEESLNLAQEANPNSSTNETARESCKILAEAHKNLKSFEEAYNYQNLYIEIKDAIERWQKTLALNMQTQKYEKEAHEREAKYKADIQKKHQKEVKEFRDTIQYSLIVLIFIMLFGGILFVGKLDLSQNMIDTMIFLSVLLLSRFFIVLIMPLASSYGADAPLVNLGANFMLALFFAPLQKFLERKLKKKVAEDIAEEGEKDRLRAQVKQLSEQIEQQEETQAHKEARNE
jgi:tetratricopeptide (TPR) repeat protein